MISLEQDLKNIVDAVRSGLQRDPNARRSTLLQIAEQTPAPLLQRTVVYQDVLGRLCEALQAGRPFSQVAGDLRLSPTVVHQLDALTSA